MGGGGGEEGTLWNRKNKRTVLTKYFSELAHISIFACNFGPPAWQALEMGGEGGFGCKRSAWRERGGRGDYMEYSPPLFHSSHIFGHIPDFLFS